MKKTFKLTHPKLQLARLVESIKHEVKKYIKRERRRDLPEGADYWDFDCRFGADAESSVEIHMTEINKSIDWAESEKLETFYLEIMVKPCVRNKRPVAEEDEIEE